MSTAELTPEQQTEANLKAFNDGFNGVQGDTEVVVAPDPKPDPKPTEEDDPSLLEEIVDGDRTVAGLSNDELQNLLAQVAEVPQLRDGLAKAHGKIGELNSKLQEKEKTPAPVTPAQDVALDPQFETDYGEFAGYAKKVADATEKRIRDEFAGFVKPEVVNKLVADAVAERFAEVDAMLEERALTAMHADWKAVLNDNGYKVWLATQPEEVRVTVEKTPFANELGKVIGDYKTWQGKAKDRSTASKQRLAQALTPDGIAARQPPEPTAEDEFRAGFNAVNNRK